MTDLRTVLVDDEQLARDELGYLLGQVGGVEVIAQAGNGLEAYDSKIPELASWEEQMSAKVREMAAQYGEQQCGHH